MIKYIVDFIDACMPICFLFILLAIGEWEFAQALYATGQDRKMWFVYYGC